MRKDQQDGHCSCAEMANTWPHGPRINPSFAPPPELRASRLVTVLPHEVEPRSEGAKLGA